MDWPTLIRSALPDTLDPGIRAAVEAGIIDRMNRGGLLARLRAAHLNGDSFAVRVATREGRPVVRLRHLVRSGGVGFYDFAIAECEASPCATDIFSVATGLWMSDEMAQSLSAMLPDHQGISAETAGRVIRLGVVHRLIREERWGEAFAAYGELPEELQAVPTMMHYRLEAAAHLDDQTYLETLDELLGRFPGSVTTNLVAIDAYLLREQWTKLRRALAVVRAELPDPYWLVLEALADLAEGDVTTFYARIDQCVREDPDLRYAYEMGLSASLILEKLERANEFLRALVSKFHVAPEELANEDYPGVRQLEAFQNLSVGTEQAR
ncbi:MAG: hypothetical protein AAGE52_34555 [Myxococcota bacterium]